MHNGSSWSSRCLPFRATLRSAVLCGAAAGPSVRRPPTCIGLGSECHPSLPLLCAINPPPEYLKITCGLLDLQDSTSSLSIPLLIPIRCNLSVQNCTAHSTAFIPFRVLKWGRGVLRMPCLLLGAWAWALLNFSASDWCVCGFRQTGVQLERSSVFKPRGSQADNAAAVLPILFLSLSLSLPLSRSRSLSLFHSACSPLDIVVARLSIVSVLVSPTPPFTSLTLSAARGIASSASCCILASKRLLAFAIVHLCTRHAIFSSLPYHISSRSGKRNTSTLSLSTILLTCFPQRGCISAPDRVDVRHLSIHARFRRYAEQLPRQSACASCIFLGNIDSTLVVIVILARSIARLAAPPSTDTIPFGTKGVPPSLL